MIRENQEHLFIRCISILTWSHNSSKRWQRTSSRDGRGGFCEISAKRFGEAISDFCIALSDNEEATVGERQPRETHDAYPYVVVSGMELIEVLDAVQHHGESLTSAKNALTLQHAAHTTAVLASVARARADMHMARDVRYSVIPVLTRDEFTATSHHELEMILRSQTKVPSMLALIKWKIDW